MYQNVYKYDDMKRSEHMAVRKTFGWYYFTHQIVEVMDRTVMLFWMKCLQIRWPI